MAAVRVIRPPVCGDAASTVPRDQWPVLLEERQRFCRSEIKRDCRLLLFFVSDAAESQWLGFQDRESYLRDGLGLDPSLVEWALEGLKRTDPEAAVTFDQAVVLGRHGQHGRGRPKDRDSNTTSIGRGSEYTLARLRRDNPELAELVEQGELSANAAAIKAGFRERTISIPINVEKAARAIQRHFTASEISRICELLLERR